MPALTVVVLCCCCCCCCLIQLYNEYLYDFIRRNAIANDFWHMYVDKNNKNNYNNYNNFNGNNVLEYVVSEQEATYQLFANKIK